MTFNNFGRVTLILASSLLLGTAASTFARADPVPSGGKDLRVSFKYEVYIQRN